MPPAPNLDKPATNIIVPRPISVPIIFSLVFELDFGQTFTPGVIYPFAVRSPRHSSYTPMVPVWLRPCHSQQNAVAMFDFDGISREVLCSPSVGLRIAVDCCEGGGCGDVVIEGREAVVYYATWSTFS